MSSSESDESDSQNEALKSIAQSVSETIGSSIVQPTPVVKEGNDYGLSDAMKSVLARDLNTYLDKNVTFIAKTNANDRKELLHSHVNVKLFSDSDAAEIDFSFDSSVPQTSHHDLLPPKRRRKGNELGNISDLSVDYQSLYQKSLIASHRKLNVDTSFKSSNNS